MNENQFDLVGDLVEIDDLDIQGKDSLYRINDDVPIARRLTFVLFDEIVEESPAQSRTVVFNPAKNKEDKELLESIKVHGIVTPITVRTVQGKNNKKDKRVFALVSGHRRVAAGKAANLLGVEGVVTKTDDDHVVLTIVENLGRLELSSFEKGMALQSLKEQRDFSVRQVAVVTGLSKSYVSELLQALQSPKVLKTIWAEGGLSPKAIILLKDHWALFEQKEAAPLLKNLRGLSRTEASDLSAQLSAGKSLKKALAMVNGNGQISRASKSPGKGAIGPDTAKPGMVVIQKDELLAAISEVFPGIKEKQGRVLYDYAVVNGIKDPEVLWAAALYVDRGGNINKAIELTSAVMKKRSLKSLISREVNLMKKVACDLKAMKKENKTIRDYLQLVFSSRR